VYAVPFVRPVTEKAAAGLPVERVDGEPPAGVYSTTYSVIAEPPLFRGLAQDSETLPSPVVPKSDVGEPGEVARGEMLELGSLYGPVPTSVTAATLKTYGEPFVSPVTLADVAEDVPSGKVDHETPLFPLY